MPIQVKLFASLREGAGWSERPVTPDAPPATPLSLWRQLGLSSGGSAAGNGALPQGIRVAINRQFASAETPLADGDELAFLPPITGG
jgi:molybdopterin synthase sulfur carrier subunit